MKKIKRINAISSVLLVCVFILSTVMPIAVAASAAVEQEKVKVGFFESDGYHIKDSRGIMSGYGYDFLQMLLRYNDWEYDFIGFDKNWGEMLSMLDNGEIDILTLADKTPEREKKYSYSTESIGTSSTVMTMNSENTDIIIGDISSYKGKRIGLVEGSSHNAGFDKYAAEKGFTYVPVFYSDIEELLSDLRHNKNIDIAVTSNMRVLEDELILDEFDATDYYAIVKKGNEELLEKINNGIRQLDIYSQNWRNALFNKYFSNINNNVISITPEEREYIKNIKESGVSLKLAMNPELKPYSYFENGEAKGIVPRIFGEISKRIDIPYEILPSSDRWEYKKQLNSGEADIDLTAYLDYCVGQLYNLKETDAYMTTNLAMLYTSSSNQEQDKMKVATVKDPTEFYGYNDKLIYMYDYIEYNSIEECIEAVKNKEADATFCYVYMAEEAINTDYKNKLKYNILPDFSLGLSLGVINNEDHRLLSILNKSINSISKEYIDKILIEESTSKNSNSSLRSLIYSNPQLVIIIVVLIMAAMFFALLSLFHFMHQKQKLLSSYEFERFIGYICESYDQIEEIDLKNRQKVVYEIKDGKVSMQTMPYQGYNEQYFKPKVSERDLDVMTKAFSEDTIDNMFKNNIKEQNFECVVKNAEGENKWYSYIIKVIPQDKKHPKNMIVFKKNIQQMKQNEEKQNQVLRSALENAQKANDAKGTFVSKISHEVRTPLNAIIGYLNIASENIDDHDKIEHCINNSKSASNHLLSLINDVLDFSAIENEKLKIANERFDLKDIITSVSNVYRSQSEEHNINFKIDIVSLSEEWVIGDSLRVKQILINILSNSVKFTPEGGSIKLLIEQVKEDNDKLHIRFTISDTGIGMDKAYMKHIFTAFEQENASTAKKYGGSGLGLSITKNLIDLMEGSIQVESEKNVGTTMRIILPFRRCTQENKNNISFEGVRVIAVESDKIAAEYIQSLFKRCGVKCDVAATAKKAIRRIAGRNGTDYQYSICLIDDTCEGINGREIAKEITAEKEHPDVVAIVYNADEVSEAASVLGVKKLIEKPLFQSSMVDLLTSLYSKENKISVKEEEQSEILKGVSVLLAEDNEMNMEISVHILEREGMKVAQAVDGREVSDMFINSQPGTYELILMDIQMPYMDGYEATEKIRNSAHPEAKTIPIVALTANAFAEDVSKTLNSGMNAHISKPVSTEKLCSVLEKILLDKE